MSQQTKKKRYRLNSVSISELSLVDKGAVTAEGQPIGQNFILFKRDGGNNNMELKDLEAKEAELKKKEEDLKKQDEDLKKREEDVRMKKEELKKAEDVVKSKDEEIAALKAKISELDSKKDSDEITALKAKIKELEDGVSKRSELEEILKDLSASMEVMKVGRKVSKKNLDLIKSAMDSLSKLMAEIQEIVEADEMNKAFEALPKEEQDKILKDIDDLTKSLG